MAFCNSCGTTLQPGAKFCAKCGATLPAVAPPAVTPAAPPAQGSNTLKIVLIVVAVLIGLGVIGTATAGFIAWNIARRTHVESRDGKVRVETPMGVVVSSNDSEDAVKNLGIEVYPGAHATKGGAATLNAGAMHSVTAEFETDDPPERVAEFYKSKMPHATFTSSDERNFSIMSAENGKFVTVTISSEDGKTKINIANVSGKGTPDSGSSNDSD